MANVHRGEVEFEASGQKWTLVYSINALCELEEELGSSINEIVERFSDQTKIRLKTVRAVLWAGLREHHPEVDPLRAGELIAELSLMESINVIGRGFALAFPQAEAKENPPTPGAGNGTGRVSTAPGAGSGVTKKPSGEGRRAKSV